MQAGGVCPHKPLPTTQRHGQSKAFTHSVTSDTVAVFGVLDMHLALRHMAAVSGRHTVSGRRPSILRLSLRFHAQSRVVVQPSLLPIL